MPEFDFVERAACVCGEALHSRGPVCIAQAAWGPVTYRRCTHCASWCQHPQIAASSLSAWYDSDAYQGSAAGPGAGYGHYLADEAERLSEADDRFRRDLAPALPLRGGRVIEIGCATGSLLSVIRAAGHEVIGIDVSQRFADAGRTLYGLDVIVSDVIHADVGLGVADAVVLLGTASNLSDLPEVLRRIRLWLRPGGLLLLNAPTADSWVARAYGPRHWMFTPSVITFMSRRGCIAALTNAGFSVRRLSTDQQRPSVGKVLHHTQAGRLLPRRVSTWLEHRQLPGSVAIPGVMLIHATAV